MSEIPTKTRSNEVLKEVKESKIEPRRLKELANVSNKKREIEINVSYLESRLEKLSKQPPPVPEWIVFHIAEICIRLIDSHYNTIAQILEKFILTQSSHYARCGLYVIDAICNDIFASKRQNKTIKNISRKYPPQKKNICSFLSTIDEMLPRLFYSFIKREKHRIIQLAPIDESQIKLSTNDQLWIQKLLRRWYQHHFFRDNTIIYIIEKLHLSVPTRKENQKRKWKEIDNEEKPPKKKIKHQHYKSRNLLLLDLPDEILIRIFELLVAEQICTIATINSRFYRLSKDRSLWKQISIKQQEKTSLNKLINWTKQSWNQIESISFPFCDQMNDEILEIFSKNFHNLKRINLKGCSKISTIHSFIELISSNENSLTFLDISFLDFSRPSNTDSDVYSKLISHQISSCKDIEELFVSNFQLFSYDTLVEILNSCTKLAVLDICCCPWLFGSLSRGKCNLSNSVRELYFMLPDPSLTQKKKHAVKIINQFPLLTKLHMNYIENSNSTEKTILDHVQVKLLDSRIAVQNQDLDLLKHLISNDPSEIHLHYYGKISLLGKAIEFGNINIIEYLFSLFIPIETLIENHIFKMLKISKTLYLRSGKTDRIEKTILNADHFEFLLRFLLELIHDDQHFNLCTYCGNLIDVFCSNNVFIRWVFFNAKQVCFILFFVTFVF